MASTSIENFLPEVLPQAPGCSSILAVNAVRNALVDFCTESLIWNSIQDAEPVSDVDFPYAVTAPANAVPVAVMSIRLDGRSLTPTLVDALNRTNTEWESLFASNADRYYFPSPMEVSVYPRLSGTVSMVMRVAYAPSRSASAVEAFLYEQYLEEIAAGALAKLLRMPAQPWSNPTLADFYGEKFETAISDAQMDFNREATRMQQSIQMRRFA